MSSSGLPPGTARLVPVLLLTLFLSVSTGSMVNVALPWIAAWAASDAAAAGWVVSGYLLTFAVFNVVHGGLADRVGARRLYLVGMAVFGLGGVASALAPSLEVLVLVRVVQGAGAAALSAIGVTIVGRAVPPEHRGTAMGAVMATVGVSASIAPFLGGLILQGLSWRAIVLVPAGALLLLPLAARALPAHLDEVTEDRPFDFVGALLLVVGTGAAMLGADLVRRDPGGFGLPLAGAGGVLLVVGWFWSLRAPVPFLPPAVLRIAAFRSMLVTGAVANGLRFGTLVLVPLMLRECFDSSPLTIGVVLVPGAVLLAACSPPAGRIAGARGPRGLAASGLLGLVLSCVLMAALLRLGAVGAAVAMGAFGIAFAAVQPSLLTGLGDVLPRPLAGVGSGFYMMCFFLGAALGVALSMSVLSAQAPETQALLGSTPPGTGRYVNTLLLLALVGACALPVTAGLPGKSRTTTRAAS